MKQLFTSTLLACGLPLLGYGQAALPQPFPRLYLGVGVATYPSYILTKSLLPNVVLGYQLRPRLAFQTSFVAYQSFGSSAGYGSAYVISSNGTTRYGPSYAYVSRAQGRTSLLNVAARYSLTSRLLRHWQVDVVGGLLLDHTRRHYEAVQTDSVGTVLATATTDGVTNQVRLHLGPSVRYEFGRHLGAVLDLSLSHSFTGGYPTDFGLAGAVGLRYRWEYRYRHL